MREAGCVGILDMCPSPWVGCKLPTRACGGEPRLVVSSSRRLPSVSLFSSLMFDVRTLTADALVGMMYDV